MISDRAAAPRAGGKAFWKTLHRWLGFSLGLIYLLLGLSGTALLFKDEILAWQYPALAAPPVPALPLATWLGRVEAAHPDFRLVRLPRAGQPWFQLHRPSGEVLYLDGQGQVLLVRGEGGDWLAWFEAFHHRLLLGEAGEWFLALVALGTLALLVLGLWLWWPRPGHWRQGLRLDWSAGGVRRWFDLHKFAGALAGLVLLFSAGTGLMMTGHGLPQTLFTSFDRQAVPVPPKQLAEPTGQRLAWGELLTRARAALPEGEITLVGRPSTDKPLLLRMRLPGEWHPNGRGGVALHPGSGALLFRLDVREQGAGARTAFAMYPLHAGKVGGAAMTALMLIAGLAPLLLFWSGLKLWLKRRGLRLRR